MCLTVWMVKNACFSNNISTKKNVTHSYIIGVCQMVKTDVVKTKEMVTIFMYIIGKKISKNPYKQAKTPAQLPMYAALCDAAHRNGDFAADFPPFKK